MRIRKLELRNFMTFDEVLLEHIPDTVVLVSPNGLGKTAVLNAVTAAHELVRPYHREDYPAMTRWQDHMHPVWPEYLPSPVKRGATEATIAIEIEPNETERKFLAREGITDQEQQIGHARFVIQKERFITDTKADSAIKALFLYHSPLDGVGFVDHIDPIRFYSRRELGNFAAELSDSHTQQCFTADFHRPWTEHQKFESVKSFLADSQLSDFSLLQAEGKNVDSLELFREVFDFFFAPKYFVGYQHNEVVVQTPFGAHDIDSLSDGEKEVLHIMAHLYRFRELGNILLWDTPELHLNATLESRLYRAMHRIAPNNQYWIATHSLEFINCVPLDELFVIRLEGNNAVIEQPSEPERQSRVQIYQELGAQVGLQLVSSKVVFVEGKESHSDKRVLERLLQGAIPNVTFVAGHDCDRVLAVGTRANELLKQSVTNGDFLAIVDRDYRTDDEVRDLPQQYDDRLFIWKVHEIENLLLDPEIVYATLELLDEAGDLADADETRSALHEAAQELTDWIAADWVAWEIERKFALPGRFISRDSPVRSLTHYVERFRNRVEALGDEQELKERIEEKRHEIQRMLGTRDSWLHRLPGKQILEKFLDRRPRLNSKQYISAAEGVVDQVQIRIPEIERLKTVLAANPED